MMMRLWGKQNSATSAGGSSAEDVEHGPVTTRLTTVEENGREPSDYGSSNASSKKACSRTSMSLFFVVVLGAAAVAAILAFELPAARQVQHAAFERQAEDLLRRFESAVREYEISALWLNQQVQIKPDLTHQDFRIAYEYLNSTGLSVQAVSISMNISQANRSYIENRTRTWVQQERLDEKLNFSYSGFIGFDVDPVTNELIPGPRPEMPSYFVVRFVEPFENYRNRAALDFDISTSPVRIKAVNQAIETRKPALTERLRLIQEGQEPDAPEFSVIIMHPGIGSNDTPPPDYVSMVVIRFPEVLQRTHDIGPHRNNLSIFLYDCTPDTDSVEDQVHLPVFLGGAHLPGRDEAPSKITLTPETNLSDVRQMRVQYRLEQHLPIASQQWLFVAVAMENTFPPDHFSVYLVVALITLACFLISMWIFTSARREAKLNEIKALAEAEKAEIMVENATQAARAERELNDFIAHEVRNPLAAAISACTFVAAAVNETQPLVDQASIEAVREDVHIIESSLQFCNQLLRNMLDVHRASNNQLLIESEPVCIQRDVLDPVAAMLYRRGVTFDLFVECPQPIYVIADRLRLNQIVLNLGRNSAKFVQSGFIRLRAEVVDESVHLFVEDSGPGIPLDKRRNLFEKFQTSLDILNQGTGIGLCLCKNLVEMMGGKIWLDESYDSGLEGQRGSRFVIDLNRKPVELEMDGSQTHETTNWADEAGALPPGLSILFVDDDVVLRKLFSRAVQRVAKDWSICEAASGETALRLTQTETFDIIFIDQYMASVDKQLLGTETVRALRAQGVQSIICGLSANDMEHAFRDAGADYFLIKPFPCEAKELTRELFRILG